MAIKKKKTFFKDSNHNITSTHCLMQERKKEVQDIKQERRVVKSEELGV